MKKGILRIIFINLLCFFIVFCSAFKFSAPTAVKIENNVFQSLPAKGETTEIKIEDDKSEEKMQKEENKTSSTKKESSAESKKESEKQVSAEAIKGNIISQYNSPYKAPLSYDGVYLKNNTSLKIDIKEFLNGKIGFKIKKNNEPQVLILHTHATESFMMENKEYFTEDFSSRNRDNTKNMIAVGKVVTEKLNKAGIKTVHATIQHDYPSYTASYSRAARTITDYLKKYPSIKVVIDLHRDAVTKDNGDKVKLVTEIKGKKAAQVMLVMGSQSGAVKNFPNWKENLKLATRLHRTIEKNYPTLARPILLMSKNYNESLTTGSLLIEFGTDANTLEEALYSAEMVGDSLVKMLEELT